MESPRAPPLVLSVGDPAASGIKAIVERVDSARKARAGGGGSSTGGVLASPPPRSPPKQYGLPPPVTSPAAAGSTLDSTQALHSELEASRREVARLIAQLHSASDRFAEDRLVLVTLVEKLQAELAAAKADNKQLAAQVAAGAQAAPPPAPDAPGAGGSTRREAAVAAAADRIAARNAALEAEVKDLKARCSDLAGQLAAQSAEAQDLRGQLACLAEPSRFLASMRQAQGKACKLAEALAVTARKLRPAVAATLKALGQPSDEAVAVAGQGEGGSPDAAAPAAGAAMTATAGPEEKAPPVTDASEAPQTTGSLSADAFQAFITGPLDAAAAQVSTLAAEVRGLPDLGRAFKAAAEQAEARAASKAARQNAVIGALQARLDKCAASQASLTAVLVAMDAARQAAASNDAALEALKTENAALHARLAERAAEVVALNEVAQGCLAETQRLRGALASARAASTREAAAKQKVGASALTVLQQCSTAVSLLQDALRGSVAAAAATSSSSDAAAAGEAGMGDALKRTLAASKSLRKEVAEAGRVFTLLLTANASGGGAGHPSTDPAVIALARDTAASIEALAPTLAAAVEAVEQAAAAAPAAAAAAAPAARTLPPPLLQEGLAAMATSLQEAASTVSAVLAAPYPPAASPHSGGAGLSRPEAAPALSTPAAPSPARLFASVAPSSGGVSPAATPRRASSAARTAPASTAAGAASPFRSQSPPPSMPATSPALSKRRPSQGIEPARSSGPAPPVLSQFGAVTAAVAAAGAGRYSLGSRGRARTPPAVPLASLERVRASVTAEEADVSAVLASAHPALARKRAPSAQRGGSRGGGATTSVPASAEPATA